MQKDITYHIAYWITALLPVILGFGITLLILYLLKNKHREDDENKTH